MRATVQGPCRIGIIGGGASGVIAAANLLAAHGSAVEIILVEKRQELGRGLAYGSFEPDHLLNVRAANMSAFADRPDHFQAWLAQRGATKGIERSSPSSFVPRSVYGDYLAELLSDVMPGQLQRIRGECVGLRPHMDGWTLVVGARNFRVDIVLLAMGHDGANRLGPCALNPWAPENLDTIRRDESILIAGTGLSMADAVLSLERRGHRGPLLAMSRHGLLPAAHAVTAPWSATPPNPSRGLAHLLSWLRREARRAEELGVGWRSCVDALRPHTSALWQAMSHDQRRRFLRHARPWWDIHRHRTAPAIAEIIQKLRSEGRLAVQAGRILAAERRGARIAVTLRRKGADKTEVLVVDRLIDCSGLPSDPGRSSNPVLQALFSQGLARADRLGIGLDVTESLAVRDRAGRPADRLFAIGPLTRGVFWESVAVPDIRVQCALLARNLRDQSLSARQSAANLALLRPIAVTSSTMATPAESSAAMVQAPA